MTILEEAKQIRSEVAKLRPDTRRRYPDELRRRILDWVQRAAAEGMYDPACGRAIGVTAFRFTDWRRAEERASRSGSLALVPVEAPMLTTSSGLTLVSPSGHRLEGLSLEQAVALLRGLA
jgi:transposase